MKSGHFISHTSDESIKTSSKIVVKRLEDNPYLFGMADATEKIWQPSGMSNRFFRKKHKKASYTAWDPSSPAFVKDGSLYIPTAFCSYTGEALDKKTPLLRSMEALSKEAVRMMHLLGDESVTRVSTTIGSEQEYFLIDKDLYKKRKDLLFTGRTLIGAPASKGQEIEDHYFGVLKPKVADFMPVSGVPPDVPLLEMLMLLRYKQQQTDICYTCMPLQKSVLLFMCLSKYTLIPVTVNRYENQ